MAGLCCPPAIASRLSRSWWAVTPRSSPLAAEHDGDFTTDLDQALSDGSASIYFDAQVTSERKKSILKAIGAGKHIYTEKPIAESVEEGAELVTAAQEAGVINGVVHDKLTCQPAQVEAADRLRVLRAFSRYAESSGTGFSRVICCRPAAQLELSGRGRRRHGAGHVPPLELRPGEPVRKVQAVTARAVTHIPERWDEQGRKYAATADDAAYARSSSSRAM